MEKPLYEYLFELLDFSDKLLELMPDENWDNSYFMTLVYIEDVFDKYGRGMVLQSAQDSGKSYDEARSLMSEANKRMDTLRSAIRKLAQERDYDETLKNRSEELVRNWVKLPPDHPNLQRPDFNQ